MLKFIKDKNISWRDLILAAALKENAVIREIHKDENGNYLEVNIAKAKYHSLKPDEMKMKNDEFFFGKKACQYTKKEEELAKRNDKTVTSVNKHTPLGKNYGRYTLSIRIPVLDENKKKCVTILALELNRYKEDMQREELRHKILEIIHKSYNLNEILQSILDLCFEEIDDITLGGAFTTCGEYIDIKAKIFNPLKEDQLSITDKLFELKKVLETNNKIRKVLYKKNIPILLNLKSSEKYGLETCFNKIKISSIAFMPLKLSGKVDNVFILASDNPNNKLIVSLLHIIFENLYELMEAEGRNREVKQNLVQVEVAEKLAAALINEFNNLLSPVVGYITLMDSKKKYSTENKALIKKEYLKELKSSQERIIYMMTILRIFSRANRNEEFIDSNIFLNGFINSPLFKKNANVNFNISPNLPTIRIDRRFFEFIIKSLITNAMEAVAKKGSGKVEVSLNEEILTKSISEGWTKITEGKYLVLTVSDNGTGMNEEEIKKIFEPVNYGKPKGVGYGFSMYLIKRIMEECQNGFISIRSIKEKETNVKCYFSLNKKI